MLHDTQITSCVLSRAIFHRCVWYAEGGVVFLLSYSLHILLCGIKTNSYFLLSCGILDYRGG
jgi:hypothetical protein